MLDRFRHPTRTFVLRWAWASVVANVVIVLTGGAVRLTASGLGCPTWPRCTDSSFVAHRELGVHGVIEFGNRLLTYVLVVVAVATWVVVWRWTGKGDRRRVLATLMALGIPLQGVIGGISVLMHLNPWIVSLHLMCSTILIALSVLLVNRVAAPPVETVSRRAGNLARAAYAMIWVVLYLGTVVTGGGPHAGDVSINETADRNGLNPQVMAHVHAVAVYVLVALTVATIWQLRRHLPTSPRALRAAWILLGVELAQGAIGFAQYFTNVPVGLVELHLLGACLLVVAATQMVLRAGARTPRFDRDRSLDLTPR